MKMSLWGYRVCGASLLDAGTYEGVEHDRSATTQAALVVFLSSIAAGVGVGGWYGPRLSTMLGFAAVAFLTWIAWAMLILQIGTRLLPGPDTDSDFGELLRTVGFAAAPGMLQVFAAFPHMAAPVFIASWIWMFLAMVVAVKHALDYSHVSRALAVCAMAAVLVAAVAVAIGLMFGPALS